MPKYTYKFCDGSVSEVEVSDELFLELSAMDEQEKLNDRYKGRRNAPLETEITKLGGKEAGE